MDLPLKPELQLPMKADVKEQGAFGTHDTLVNGFASVRAQMCVPHPLMKTEQNFKAHSEKMHLAILQSTQGLHAPLRLMYEKKALSKVGRLPFLVSSNIALETLEGRDGTIGFEDFLNDPSDGVEALAPPHMVMEKHLHLY